MESLEVLFSQILRLLYHYVSRKGMILKTHIPKGILLVSICIGALAFLGVTWLDIKNSDVTDSNTGLIDTYLELNLVEFS